MDNWYEEWIEEGIRKEVKLLRDNGFNTESSCEHNQWIQCSFISSGEIKRLDGLLFDEGYRNYHITLHLERLGQDGYLHSFFEVRFHSPHWLEEIEADKTTILKGDNEKD